MKITSSLSSLLDQIFSAGQKSEFRSGGVEPQWAGSADYAQTIRDAHAGWGKLLAAVGFRKQ